MVCGAVLNDFACSDYMYMSLARSHQPSHAAPCACANSWQLLQGNELSYSDAAVGLPQPQWPSIRLTESVINACVFVFMHMGPSMMRLKRPWSDPSTTSGSLGRS